MAFTDNNTDDRLVQETFVGHLEQQLGWKNVYAWNTKVFQTPPPSLGTWLAQAQMAGLFQTTQQNIALHLKAIFAEGELSEEATYKDYSQDRQEGPCRNRSGSHQTSRRNLEKTVQAETSGISTFPSNVVR